MPADAYLKVAAGQLQQAATALKIDADKIRAEATAKRMQMEHDLSNKQAELASQHAELALAKEDPRRSMLFATKIKSLQNEIEALKKELADTTGKAEQKARDKEGAMQGLSGQAQKLEQQAGDPNMR